MSEMSDRARALLYAAHEADKPSAGDRDRVRAALSARLGAAVLAPPLAATAASATSLATVKAATPIAASKAAAPIATLKAAAAATISAKILVPLALLMASGAAVFVATQKEAAAPPSAPAAARFEESRAMPAERSEDEASTPQQVTRSEVVAPDPQQAPRGAGTQDAPAPQRARGAVQEQEAQEAHEAPASQQTQRDAEAREAPPAPPRTRRREAAPHAARRAHAPQPSSLVEETTLLREAHAALKEGDAAKSMQVLDKLAARHPDGILREERLAARILALCAAGRVDEAREKARSLLTEAPRSVHAARVRASCAGAQRSGE